MTHVYKCDFCYETNEDSTKIESHEIDCSFNPINKTCYSCKYHETDPYGCTSCDLGLNVFKGEDEGNCNGWLSRKNNDNE